ncbi:MAG: hypothetical protein E7676_05575 [Ruminococcaceae bacterium]|nr:hypothetical protein [Oscillospiraceae bacterium]
MRTAKSTQEKKRVCLSVICILMLCIFTFTGCFYEAGPQGEPGVDGVNGQDGKDGIDGQDGADGKDGVNGKDGVDGENGKDGSVWYSGIELADNQGVIGDYFYDTDDFNIYNKTAEGWVLISNIKGAEGTDGTTPTITINADGYWVINGEVTDVKAKGEIAATEEQGAWYGKTAVFVGDSITAGTGCDGDKYWQILEESMGLSNVTAMGVPGSCISAKSDYGTNNSPLIQRYNDIPEADLISIFMGTNDYGHDTPLGTIDDIGDTSFYGALNVIIPSLQAKHPDSRIVFVTPLHRYGFGGLNFDYEKNGAGFTLQDYVDAVINVCRRHSIPVIDLYSISGLNPSLAVIRNTYMPDGLHPNANGHKYIANILKTQYEIYGSNEKNEEIVFPEEAKMIIGNWISTDYKEAQNRASYSEYIYLQAGQKVSLCDNTKYLMGVYQLGLVSDGWITEDFLVNESGEYTFAFKKADDSNFDFTTESTNLYDYIVITGNN